MTDTILTESMVQTQRVFVESLEARNAGKWHGEWFTLNDYADFEGLHEDVTAYMGRDPHARYGPPEYAVSDAEGFGRIRTDRFTLGSLWDIHEAIQTDQDLERGLAFTLYVSDVHGEDYCQDVEEAKSDFDDRYRGAWDSVKDFAWDFANDLEGINRQAEQGSFTARYFDAEAFGRDLELGGDISTVRNGGELHIFDSF